MDGKAGWSHARALTRRGGALDRSITAGHLPTSLWLRFGGFGERDIIMTLRNILLGATMLRSEEHTSELQSLMRISYAVFCLKKKIKQKYINKHTKCSMLLK